MIETSIRDFTKDKKYSLQFLPKSIENLSKEKFTNFNGKDLKNSYLIDIVHNLILRYFFKKENSFNLSSLILKEKYGAYYNYYMNYLVKNKILLISKEYLKGTNARIYRLNSSIIEEEILRYKNADSTILKKYKKKVSSVEEQDLSKNSILPEIKQKIVSDLFSVNINVEKAMYYFPEIVLEAQKSYQPHFLTTYLTYLAGLFNGYYSKNKIVDGADKYSAYKVALTEAFTIVMKNGLWMLGIKTLEKM